MAMIYLNVSPTPPVLRYTLAVGSYTKEIQWKYRRIDIAQLV
jgi:hypothetical protein